MASILFHTYPAKTRFVCAECNWTGPGTAMDEITDFQERVAPGEICPAGQCPECGVLVHMPEPSTSNDDPDLAAAQAKHPDHPQDDSGWPIIWRKHYRCTASCGEKWSDDWSCQCNDKCPSCNAEIEPHDVEELDANGEPIEAETV